MYRIFFQAKNNDLNAPFYGDWLLNYKTNLSVTYEKWKSKL